jgi:hypothetical protein
MVRTYPWTRFLCLSLGLIYFLMNCALAHAAESNFWAERRRSIDQLKSKRPEPMVLASASAPGPAGMLAQLSGGAALPRTLTSGDFSPHALSAPSLVQKAFRNHSGPLPPSLPSLISALSGHGVVRDIRLAKPSSPIVVYVQDIHGQKDAQRNIAELILAVLNHDPRAAVGLEGTGGEIDVRPFRGPRQDINREVASFFLNTGYIAGPEFAAFAADQTPRFFGVEAKDLYLKNVEAVRKSLPQQAA